MEEIENFEHQFDGRDRELQINIYIKPSGRESV